MLHHCRGITLVICGCFLAGCADSFQSTLATAPAPTLDLHVVFPDFSKAGAVPVGTGALDASIGAAETAPTGVPAEFETPPSVTSAWITLDITDSEARSHAFMVYFGSHASQSLNLSASNGSVSVSLPTQTNTTSSLIPFERDLITPGRLPVPQDCGFTATAASQNEAWHETMLTFGLVTWGRTNVPRSRSASQEACPRGDTPPDEGGEPGGGGGVVVAPKELEPTSYTCYWLYEYNPDTDEITKVISVTCLANY